MTSALEIGATELWRIDLDGAADAVATHWAAIAPAPLAFDSTADARRRTAHMALRLLLAREVGCKAALAGFVVDGGKPRLASDALAFNLSHSDRVAFVALSRCGPIGVDVEAVRAMPMTEARRTVIEAAAVAVADGCDLTGAGETRTLQAWVRLEAAAKASGEGIGSLLERLNVRPGRVPPRLTGRETPQLAIVRDVDAGAGFVAAAAASRVCLPALLAAKVVQFPHDVAALASVLGVLPH